MEKIPEIILRCKNCSKVIGYYTGNNYFMALIHAGNKHPYQCPDCHRKTNSVVPEVTSKEGETCKK